MSRTLTELKQGLFKCTTENWGKPYLTGQAIVNSICESAKKPIEELEQENKRAKVLLKATLDLLRKQKRQSAHSNLLENTVFYDNVECDGYRLFDDIENFLEG